ncbi:MAG: DegV family protein [Oscillospiraceae bacterium]|nr:DegV family protein [Oscillospiraceae bacterium]
MVMAYILSCCSTADLSKEHFEAIDVKYVCFHYRMDGVEYPDDLGQSIPFDEFYKRMAAGADTSTSQVSISEYVDFFTPYLEQGLDVVHVTLSSGISGTINSAQNAAMILRERYPERKIYVIDSLGASSGYGLLMDTAAAKRDEGLTVEEMAAWLEENRLRLHHWFFSTDLSFYVKGGRISKTAAVFGGLLEICPLLNMDNLGRLIPRYKIRTKKKVIRECVKKMEEHARGGHDYDGKCFISMSACLPEARAVADLVEEKFPKLNGKVLINNIGTTIGSHTGPGTVALFFWGDERVD